MNQQTAVNFSSLTVSDKNNVNNGCENKLQLDDEKLFELCKRYGGSVLFWRQKFLGLLPRVAKRRLYEKEGFSSIFEFAKKLAGVSEEQVRVVLNLEKRFEDKKELHELLITGKVSVNKLAKIVSIATIENQEILARQAKILPCRALETFVRDQKTEDKNGLFEPKFEAKSLHVNSKVQQTGLFGKQDVELQLSSEVQQRLLELQKKGININELLKEFLDKREKEIEEEKEKMAQEVAIKSANDKSMNSLEFAERAARRLSESLIEAIGDDVVVEPLESKNSSRYVPRKIQKIIKKEYGTKCAVPTCNRPAQHLHHTLPFALSQNHDPRYLMPLCKEHHIIAHSVDQKFREVRQAVV